MLPRSHHPGCWPGSGPHCCLPCWPSTAVLRTDLGGRTHHHPCPQGPEELCPHAGSRTGWWTGKSMSSRGPQRGCSLWAAQYHLPHSSHWSGRCLLLHHLHHASACERGLEAPNREVHGQLPLVICPGSGCPTRHVELCSKGFSCLQVVVARSVGVQAPNSLEAALSSELWNWDLQERPV